MSKPVKIHMDTSELDAGIAKLEDIKNKSEDIGKRLKEFEAAKQQKQHVFPEIRYLYTTTCGSGEITVGFQTHDELMRFLNRIPS